MQQKIQPSITTYIFLIVSLFFADSAYSQLQQIYRTDETASLQLYLRFDTLPTYELNTRKRRVDLFLKNISPVETLQLPPTDDRLIKALIRPQDDGTLLSFFFRYAPQKVSENTRTDPASLMLDIFLGNQFTSMYPDLSTKFKGLTLLDRNAIDYTNPIHISPFPENWKLFFSEYESPIKITPDRTYTLPPFPIAAAVNRQLSTEEWLPENIITSARKKEWQLATQQILEQLELEKSDYFRDLLLFSYAETLVRAGEYERPHALLQQISHRYKGELLAELADFLFLYVRNLYESDFLGYFELEKIINQIWSKTPHNAYFTLLLAEAAMEMGDLEVAKNQLYRDDIGFSEHANTIRLMRKADVLYLENKKIKSLVTYLQLKNNESILIEYPSSLAIFSDLLYEFNRFKQAVTNYQLLSNGLANKPQFDLVLFRLTMSRLHAGNKQSQIEKDLTLIQEAFDRTEGVFLSLMKQTDLEFLSGVYNPDQVRGSYQKLSIQGNTVAIREEAVFKLALLELLNNDPEGAIEICLQLLREFQNGFLQVEARALIIQHLPDVVRSMVDGGRYIDALVLAQKNRTLFSRGWIDNSLLYELATAYSDLGFFDRSVRTYQYLFDVSNKVEQEQIYLPLIESLYQDGQFQLIENYADRFSFRYPESEFLPDVFLIRVKAFLRLKDIENASLLLKKPDRPTSPAIQELAVQVLFDQEEWQSVINLLTNEQPLPSNQLRAEQKKILAESYYQVGQLNKAGPLFTQLIEENDPDNYLVFRLAQIEQSSGNQEQALKRFQELAEKGKDDTWKKLAKEEIAILNLE